MYLIAQCRAAYTVMVETKSVFEIHEVCPAVSAEGFGLGHVENPNPCFVDVVGARVDLLVLLVCDYSQEYDQVEY